MQVVSTWFRNGNVDKNCKHVESIYDEDEQWVIGFIQKCEVEFPSEDILAGRFEVKIFDGPLKLNHIRDSYYVDCSKEFEASKHQKDKTKNQKDADKLEL